MISPSVRWPQPCLLFSHLPHIHVWSQMVDKIQRRVRISTRQAVLESLPKIDGVFPMREWRISVHIIGSDGQLHPADVFDRVTYELHETFANPQRVLTNPPFELAEKGWGEFELRMTLRIAHGGGDVSTAYELHFRSPESFQDITVSFPTTKKELVAKLAASGPVPQLAAPAAAASTAQAATTQPANAAAEKRGAEGDDSAGSKAKKSKVTIKGSVDLERLSKGLEQLGEQDVLSIVQMISDNKTPEIDVKNDVEAGEFHVDLFSVPNGLLKSMWDFVAKKVDV